MKVNPDELSDDEWAQVHRDYLFLRKERATIIEHSFRKVMNEVLEALFGKK